MVLRRLMADNHGGHLSPGVRLTTARQREDYRVAVTTTQRLGLTRWSADTDSPTRAQFTAIVDQLESLAMRENDAGTLATRPAAGIAKRYYFATDIGILFRDTGSAWVKVGPGSGAMGRMYRTTTQSIPNTSETDVLFSTQDYSDAAGLVDVSNNQFVIPAGYTGRWRLLFQFTLPGAGSAYDYYAVGYVANTGNYIGPQQGGRGTTTWGTGGTWQYVGPLSAGNTIRFRLTQGSGGALASGGATFPNAAIAEYLGP